MPVNDWRVRLDDILEAIGHIAEYHGGMTFDQFAADRRTIDAILYNFAVIGEAARHVPPEVRGRYPGIPWTRMSGMRNVVVHEYSGINLLIIWETATGDLPPIVPLLREILEP